MVAWVGPWEGASIPLASQPGVSHLFGVWDSLEARSLAEGRGSGAVRGFGALQRPERRLGLVAGGLKERLLRRRLLLRRLAWLRRALHHMGHPGQLSLLEPGGFKQGLSPGPKRHGALLSCLGPRGTLGWGRSLPWPLGGGFAPMLSGFRGCQGHL